MSTICEPFGIGVIDLKSLDMGAQSNNTSKKA